MDLFSKAERQVARTILAEYPLAGLETMAKLAARADVSDPTILRFLGKLGYKGFSTFQQALKEEINQRMKGPVTVDSVQTGNLRAQRNDSAEEFSRRLTANIEETVHSLPPSEVRAVCDLLRDSRSKILILGGDFTQALAGYLYFHLNKMRKNVVLITEPPSARLAYLLNLSRRDLLFVFDVRRYQQDIYDFAVKFSQHGGKIALFTDQWLSPISRYASHVLPCRIDSDSRWDSLVPMMTIVEYMISDYFDKDWTSIQSRLEKLDAMKMTFRNPEGE